jgi:hypothetical protein
VLLDPPRGSPSRAVNKDLGAGAPQPSPRPATAEESAKLQPIRDIQAAVARRLGSRKEPNTQDMTAILTSFGPNWVEMLPMYQLAINTMDQDVCV